MYYRKRYHNSDWDVISSTATSTDDPDKITLTLPFHTSGYNASVLSGCISPYIDPIVSAKGGELSDTSIEAFKALEPSDQDQMFMFKYAILFKNGIYYNNSADRSNMYAYFDGAVHSPNDLHNRSIPNWKFSVSPLNYHSKVSLPPTYTKVSSVGYEKYNASNIILITCWMPLPDVSYNVYRLVQELGVLVGSFIPNYIYNKSQPSVRTTPILTALRNMIKFTYDATSDTVTTTATELLIGNIQHLWVPTLPSMSVPMAQVLGMPSLPLLSKNNQYAFVSTSSYTGIPTRPAPSLFYIYCKEARLNATSQGVVRSLVGRVVPNSDGTFVVSPQDRVYIQPIKGTTTLTFEVERADRRSIVDYSKVRRLHIRLTHK